MPFDLPTHEQGLIQETKTLCKCIKVMNLLSIHSFKMFKLKYYKRNDSSSD